MFVNHFGTRIYDFFLDHIMGAEKSEGCPVMGVLLRFFYKKQIELSELFLICDNFKWSLIDLLLASGEASREAVNAIFEILQANFVSLIDEYFYIRGIEVKRSDHHSVAIPTFTTVEPRPTREVNAQMIDSEDLAQLDEVPDELEEATAVFYMESPSIEQILRFAQDAERLGAMLRLYGAFEELGLEIGKMARAFEEHPWQALENRYSLSVLLGSFLNDFALWRRSIAEDGGVALQPSILANIRQIVAHLCETGEAVEFF
ncbi:MAG: hypothetical protein K6347_06630 [Campylobacterales bacterium]